VLPAARSSAARVAVARASDAPRKDTSALNCTDHAHVTSAIHTSGPRGDSPGMKEGGERLKASLPRNGPLGPTAWSGLTPVSRRITACYPCTTDAIASCHASNDTVEAGSGLGPVHRSPVLAPRREYPAPCLGKTWQSCEHGGQTATPQMRSAQGTQGSWISGAIDLCPRLATERAPPTSAPVCWPASSHVGFVCITTVISPALIALNNA